MQTTDGRGAQEKSEKKPPWSALLGVVGTVITAVGVLVVELIGAGYLQFTLWLTAVWLVLVVAGLILSNPELRKWIAARIFQPSWEFLCACYRRVRNAGETLSRSFVSLWKSGWGFSLLTLCILGAFVAGSWLGWTAFTRWKPDPRPADAALCRRPLELRALASPEIRDAIQDAGDRFAEAQVKSGNCPPVHITVFSEASFTAIRDAFTRRWLDDPSRQTPGSSVERFIGPQPDIWLPGSSAVVGDVDNHSHPDVDLKPMGSIASSPMVFAVWNNYREQIKSHLPKEPKLRDFVDAALKVGQELRVARPDPILSETGLLATADLYRASRDAKDGDDHRHTVEGKVASVGAPLSNAQDLFCSIRENQDTKVAAIVAEQTVSDYNQGKPLGVGCPLPETGLAKSYYAFLPEDAHSLDYPFVRLTWHGQADELRDAAIDRFKAWLDSDHLRNKGFRDTAGRGENLPLFRDQVPVQRFGDEDIDGTLDDYRRARTRLAVAFTTDLSRSMNKAALQVSRLDRARELVAAALEQFGPADSIGLARFPPAPKATSAELTRVDPWEDDQIDKTGQALAGLGGADGGSTPLYNAIDDAVGGLADKGDNPVVVAFTDGDDRGSSATVEELHTHLAAAAVKPRIVLLALGPKECTEPDLKALTDSKIATCRPARSDEPDRLMSQVIDGLRKGTTR